MFSLECTSIAVKMNTYPFEISNVLMTVDKYPKSTEISSPLCNSASGSFFNSVEHFSRRVVIVILLAHIIIPKDPVSGDIWIFFSIFSVTSNPGTKS